MTKVANDIENGVRAASPSGETGELARSWSSKVVNQSAIVTSDAPHAGFPEWGTRSPILPKPDNNAGGYLVFYIGGRKIVTKKVKGQKPQLYIFNVLRKLFPGSRIDTPQISHFKS